MSKVTVIAKITCQEGTRDELVAAFADYFPQVEGEEGTLLYAVSVDNGDPNVVWVYELYTGEDALSAHGGSDAFKAFGGKLAGMLAGAPELHFCRPVHAKGHDL